MRVLSSEGSDGSSRVNTAVTNRESETRVRSAQTVAWVGKVEAITMVFSEAKEENRETSSYGGGLLGQALPSASACKHPGGLGEAQRLRPRSVERVFLSLSLV
jgi:hypothetical protein